MKMTAEEKRAKNDITMAMSGLCMKEMDDSLRSTKDKLSYIGYVLKWWKTISSEGEEDENVSHS